MGLCWANLEPSCVPHPQMLSVSQSLWSHCLESKGKTCNLLTEEVCVIVCVKCMWKLYIYPCESMLFCECMRVCLCTVYRGKSHCSLSARACADILALPKNPQWSSPIQQPCPNKLCTSRLFSHFLCASLPHSYPFPCFSFDCHLLANPDHTIEPNHIRQFKLALFSLCVSCASKHLSTE